MFLMVLVGFAALAIDIGHGYLVAQRAQNAADAAALAGTVYLPADPTTAYSTVQSVAAANGFPASVATVSAVHVRRTAIADYDQPVAMGSPANTFGNQPDTSLGCSPGRPVVP